MRMTSVGTYALPCDVPASFPVESYDRLAKLLGTASHLPAWTGATEALNGVVQRYRGALEAHERFASVFGHAFGGDKWYAEEAAIFDVFMFGVSAIECAAYSAYHLGAIVNDSHLPSGAVGAKFPIATDADLRVITLKGTRNAFAKHATGSPMHLALRDCVDDPKCQKLYEYRDVLAHRLIPSRRSEIAGPVGGIGVVHIAPENVVSTTISGSPKSAVVPHARAELSTTFTQTHVDTVTRWVTAILTAGAALIDQRLSGVLVKTPPPWQPR